MAVIDPEPVIPHRLIKHPFPPKPVVSMCSIISTAGAAKMDIQVQRTGHRNLSVITMLAANGYHFGYGAMDSYRVSSMAGED
jgi:hypothetical protein